MGALYVVGDAVEVLELVPDESLDLVIGSPPFLAKRRYLKPGDPAARKEIGAEPTPGEFVDSILRVADAAAPKLTRFGSLVFEIGDTYAGSGGAGGDYAEGGLRDGQARYDGTAVKARNLDGWTDRPRPARVGRPKQGAEPRNTRSDRRQDEAAGVIPVDSRWRGERDGWPLDKSLCMVPELVRIALVYGFNPLTGRTCTRWRGRNVVRWVRTNPPVGALADKFRPGTTDLVVACLNDRRYWDVDAVRTAPDPANWRGTEDGYAPPGQSPRRTKRTANAAGAPPLDWWVVAPQPYRGAHYATWPAKLLDLPIRVMSPERACARCGEPSVRLTRTVVEDRPEGGSYGRKRSAAEPGGPDRGLSSGPAKVVRIEQLGWSDCGCGDGCRPTAWRVESVAVEEVKVEGRWTEVTEVADAEGLPARTKVKRKRVVAEVGECRDPSHWRRGRVLDPFAGTGTTLSVALGLGRDAFGIDLDRDNVGLALDRVGLFLDVASPAELAARLGEGLPARAEAAS